MMLLKNNLLITTLSLLAPLILHAYDATGEFHRLARSCANEGKTDKALTYYKQALRTNPKNFEAAFDAANMLYNADRAEEALVFYKQALNLNDSHAEVYYNYGLCLLRLEKFDEAYVAFAQAAKRNPHYIKTYVQMANIYVTKKDYAHALEIYEAALKINPDSFDLYYRMGSVLRSLEQYTQAVKAFEKALEMQPNNPYPILELANTLHMVDDYERSLELYRKALELKPDCAEALYNLGYTLKKCGDIKKAHKYFEEALEVHARVLEMRPDYPLAHFSHSLSNLTLGKFEEGWPEYEYRWQSYNEKPKEFPQPVWSGQDLNGKRILIYAEQGFGDTFQFIRYGKLLKERGAYVIAQTQHQLKDIISQCQYLDEVLSDREQLPPFDYHIALMSIPMVVNTTLETVPNEIPYLNAKEELTKLWKEKLSSDKKFKVGICWQGNKQYRTVFLKKEVASKAMRLETFEPIASVPGVSVYSLQKINGVEQLEDISKTMEIHTFGPDLDEASGRFMDTAAIMKNLDLVITVDTSIGHLAAGLGAEVWVLLPYPADWRWMLDRDDTPWYPNMRLFRQPERGDWDSVLTRVVQELQEKVEAYNREQHVSDLKKKRNPSLFDRYAHRNDIRVTAQEELPTELSNIVDTMTQRSLAIQDTRDPNHRRGLIHDHKVLQERYQPYMQSSEELKALTQQLLLINKRLWELDKELAAGRSSIFEESFMNLVTEIYKIQALKKMVLNQINEISQQLTEKADLQN